MDEQRWRCDRCFLERCLLRQDSNAWRHLAGLRTLPRLQIHAWSHGFQMRWAALFAYSPQRETAVRVTQRSTARIRIDLGRRIFHESRGTRSREIFSPNAAG